MQSMIALIKSILPIPRYLQLRNLNIDKYSSTLTYSNVIDFTFCSSIYSEIYLYLIFYWDWLSEKYCL